MCGVYKLTAEAQIYAYKIMMFKFAVVYSPKDQFNDYTCECGGLRGDDCQPNQTIDSRVVVPTTLLSMTKPLPQWRNPRCMFV